MVTMDMEASNGGGKGTELLRNTIEQLIEFKNTKLSTDSGEIGRRSESASEISPTANCDGEEIRVLSKLISQLESLKEDGIIDEPASSTGANKAESGGDEAIAATSKVAAEEIAKELNDVKKQNRVTHMLVSAMIFLTVFWQLSEVTMILKVRDGFNHPFRYLWGFVKRIAGRPVANGRDTEKQDSLSSSIKDTLVESASLPLKLGEYSQDMEVPSVQIPGLGPAQDK